MSEPNSEPVRDRQQLIEYFQQAAEAGAQRPRRMGIELELLAVRPPDFHAVGFSEPQGIHALLERLSASERWEPVLEGGKLLELRRGAARLTLEPGSQTELSLGAHVELRDNLHELEEVLAELHEGASALGFRWLGLGVHPFQAADAIELLPKRRYGLMDESFRARGEPCHLARWMMRATASLQVNLDYVDEADAMEQMRVGLGIAPLTTALAANSPFRESSAHRFASFRAHIWHFTDPDRCGIPDLFSPDCSFADYVDFALEIPLLFIVEGDGWQAGGGRDFNTLLRDGKRDGTPATLQDWEIHINSIFTEVRLKKYVEVRSMDAPRPDAPMALAALWAGVLYDPQARREAWQLVADLSLTERRELLRAVARHGLQARLRGRPLWSCAAELLEAARGGLQRLGYAPVNGRPAADLLAPLQELAVGSGRSSGEVLRSAWLGPWDREPGRLVAAVAYGSWREGKNPLGS